MWQKVVQESLKHKNREEHYSTRGFIQGVGFMYGNAKLAKQNAG